jgi:hypothetical protein
MPQIGNWEDHDAADDPRPPAPDVGDGDRRRPTLRRPRRPAAACALAPRRAGGAQPGCTATGHLLALASSNGTTFPAQISLSPVRTAAGRFILAAIRDVTETRPLEDLAVPARTAVTAEQEHRGRDLPDTIITALFHVGLGLQTAIDLPAEAARQRITEALGGLDEIISQIRGTAFTGNGHQDTARVAKPGHDHPGG